MKLTKNKLKQIIKEEFSAAMEEENGPEGEPTMTASSAEETSPEEKDALEQVTKLAMQMLKIAEEAGVVPHSEMATGGGDRAYDPDTGERVFETTS
tara:strand:+ start:530 stop:817 length:288 start_codon:yes stop_codon:yes gene_type:complete